MQTLLFPNFKSDKDYIFETTELGRLHKTLPLDTLAKLLPQKNTLVGAPSWLDNKGMIALMFLKTYIKLSDGKLIGRLNADWEMQLFCGIQLRINERIQDINLPSSIRCYLAKHLDMDKLQETLFEHWKPELNNKHVVLMDATVYESYIKYPTDVKLLWDCCQWLSGQLYDLCPSLSLPIPRSKYKEQTKAQLAYSRCKKKSHKKTKKRRKSLIYLADKLLNQLQFILDRHASGIECTPAFTDRLKVIRTILTQQRYMHQNPGEYASDRIVSLYKPYLRPIVRGKELQRVEFGAKVHMMQIDGICYIEHFDYSAFNEGCRLEKTVSKHEELAESCSQVGGDRIYATNKNRTFLSKNKINHSFPPKGKGDNPQKKQLRKILGTARATRMEGAFGNHKNHYGLDKIKARKEDTEKLWIFFGVMTANAAQMASRTKKVERIAA